MSMASYPAVSSSGSLWKGEGLGSCFSCLEDHSPKAACYSAPDYGVVSRILSSFLVVYGGKLSLVLVPPS